MTDLTDTFHHAPVGDALKEALAVQGLTVRRVDDSSRAESDAWSNAVARGFLDPERNEAQQQAFFDRAAYQRKIGVYDEAGPQPLLPVATFASWGAHVTLPGGADAPSPTVPACAISAVTVAPTHRRRGLLRGVMSSELRTAAAVGFPVAALTVSESSIYGRFGFAPAALAAQWTLDVRRAGWVGPQAPGRIDFLTREQGRARVEQLHDRVRAGMPGEIEMPRGHWDRVFGTRPDVDKPGGSRVVQYRSPAGEVDGLAVYSVAENADDYAASRLDLGILLAATPEAYAGLWRFLLSMDLIATIRAGELAVDEPLWWMIADQRAARIEVRDHHYLRILDVPATLSARRYDVADSIVVEVRDALGIAEGTFVLTTDVDGSGLVEAVDDPPLGLPSVRLGVAELSALLLGGVSAVTLARAGRIEADDAQRVARLFGTASAPRLSFWY